MSLLLSDMAAVCHTSVTLSGPTRYAAPRFAPPKDARARALSVRALAVLVPLVPFAAIGELPGERWLLASAGDAARFGATGAALLAADLLLPIPSSVIGALLGGRLGLWAG